jgi:glycosyltransferase involved in cell wall biosynthesis
MPLHVAHFIHRYPPAVGGAEAYFARLGEYFASCGDAVSVWTSTAVELAEMWGTVSREATPSVCSLGVASRLTVRRYSPLTFPLRRYLLKALSLLPVRPWQLLTSPSNPVMPAMWRDVNRYSGPLDAVHATAFPYGFPLMCGLRLARRRKVPFLLTPFLHLGDPTDPHDRTRRQYTSPPLVWLLKKADRVFVQTPSEFELAAKFGVKRERLVLQGLGVEQAECTGGDRAKARAAWGVGDAFVVGHLANNSVEKGTVDLLKAAGSPRGGDERVIHLVLTGPAMPNFLQFWQSWPHQSHVTRLGVLSDDQKRDFFAGIDAFCLPSRTDSFGLVLLEAWANDKPVVAYRAGGPADLIRDGIDGVLVKCGDVAELRAKLRQLASDRELARKMGEAGRQRVATDFRWERSLRMVRDIVVSLIQR